jgi:hypothetical protein
MSKDRAKDAMRRYSAALSPNERTELARTLIEASSATGLASAGRAVPNSLVWISRIGSLAVASYYWYLTGFVQHSLLQLALSLFLPIAVVWFPNQLARATGRLGVSPKITIASPPRAVLALGWVILLVPIVARAVR